jgi:plastocyanin
MSVPAAAAGAAIAFGGLAASAANQSVQIVATGAGCTSAFCFVPSTVNATQGDAVTWTNTTTAPHTVTRCDTTNCAGQDGGTGSDTFGSPGNIAPGGGTYQHTFVGAGTYFYYCAVHGYAVMHGEVVAATAPPTPEAPTAGLLVVAAGGVLGVAIAVRRRRHRASPEPSD